MIIWKGLTKDLIVKAHSDLWKNRWIAKKIDRLDRKIVEKIERLSR